MRAIKPPLTGQFWYSEEYRNGRTLSSPQRPIWAKFWAALHMWLKETNKGIIVWPL